MRLKIVALALLGLSLGSEAPNHYGELIENIKTNNYEAVKKGLTKTYMRHYGKQLLKLACENGNMEIATLLMTSGALPFGNEHERILDVAVESGNKDLVYRLVEYGADPKKANLRTISIIALNGDLEMMKYFYEHGYQFKSGEFEIFDSAVLSESKEMVAYLLEINIQLKPSDCLEVCQKASMMGNSDIISLLLSRLTINSLKSVLDLAITNGNYYMVKVVTGFVVENGKQLDGTVWSDYFMTLCKERRMDIATAMMSSLDPTNLASCLMVLFKKDPATIIAYFKIAINSMNLAEAIKLTPTLAKLSINLGINHFPEVVDITLQNSCPAGLSLCFSALRRAKRFDLLGKALQQTTSLEALRINPVETYKCFNGAFEENSNISYTILRLLNGTIGLPRLIDSTYRNGNQDQLNKILSSSENIKDVMRLCPKSADNIYELATKKDCLHMKQLCSIAISGQTILSELFNIMDNTEQQVQSQIMKCREFLNNTNDESIADALNIANGMMTIDKNILEILTYRLFYPIFAARNGNPPLNREIFDAVLKPYIFNSEYTQQNYNSEHPTNSLNQ